MSEGVRGTKRDEGGETLRERAEAQVGGAGAEGLVHELSVHQVELEMQNAELREAQRRLESARDGFARLYHLAPVGYVTLDENGIIQQWNWTFAGMISEEAVSFLNKPLVEYLVEEDQDRFRGRYHAFFRQPGGKAMEVRLRGARSQVVSARLTGRLAAGDLLGQQTAARPLLFVAVTDVTQQKEAEAALAESERRWQYALEGAAEGVWDLHPATNYAYYSAQWKALVGYEGGEIADSLDEWRSRVHPKDRGACFEALRRHIEGATGVFQHEYRMRCRDGSYRWMMARGKAMERDGQGRAVRVIGTQADVTEWKKTEARLLQVEKMESVGRLAGGIAHDFNNLLTVINGYSQLLLGRLERDHPIRGQLLEIQKAGARAASLTGQLLAFSRKQMLQPKLLDLNRVVEELRPMLEPLLGERVELEASGAGEPVWVQADAAQLDAVVMNLAANARDAMPEGGRLRIGTRYAEEGGGAGRWAVMSVSDSGCGMDEETRERIFDPFFTTKGPGKGTGLGLSMAHGFVAQSGGYITVVSEPGRGTSFDIHLPAVAGAETEAEEEGVAGAVVGGRETVLVVEDEPEVLRYTASVLESLGYRTLRAGSAEEAMEVSAEERGKVHLLLTDVVLPKLGGRELARMLAGERPAIKVVFMSGYTGDVMDHHGIRRHRGDFLQKPFTPEQLAVKVRRALGRAAAAAAGGA